MVLVLRLCIISESGARHAIEQASRRSREGRDSAVVGDAPRQFDLCTVLRRPREVPASEPLGDVGAAL
jgi:hypothetical protein